MSTLTYPCNACGAKLEFAPGQHALQCPYCGAKNEIQAASEASTLDATAKRDYRQAIADGLAREAPIPVQTVKCPACSAESKLDPNVSSDRCQFCAAPLIAQNAYSSRKIRPASLAPFAIAEKDAREKFRDWVGHLWFAPNALQKALRTDKGLKGRYIPWFGYDAVTATPYVGERGTIYFETEIYEEDGERKTREVERILWTPVVGEVQVNFADVLAVSTDSLPRQYAENIGPWPLDNLVPYAEQYVSGFVVEAYQSGLEPGFEHAREEMEDEIRNAVLRDIGGDQQRIISMSPQYFDVSWRHFLLPIWLSAYRYQGKTYRFLVNGQTGTVAGERPWSAWKIAFATVATIAVAAGAWYLLHRHH